MVSKASTSVDSGGSLKTDKSVYQNEWLSLFGSKLYVEKLKSSAIKGCLNNSHFRSICWKIFLSCLPEDSHLWIDTVRAQRKAYDEILDKFDTDPRVTSETDISLNNPLSQSVESPWNQYFQDQDLKLTIRQDVVRTFPEIEFFHNPGIQKMMISILFCFAREFPCISYKQGMHELLAPIIFVLYSDHEAYLNASITDDLDLDMHILLNQNYIEHDVFFMFCKVMESVKSCYTAQENVNFKNENYYAVPFLQENEALCSDSLHSLGRKLRNTFYNLLKQHDPELYFFLEHMEITPQIFGIRWLRLLFGREFDLYDVLILWDAIFSDSNDFDLIDYIFVSMLISIRDFLIHHDYATCLSHLMHFPSIIDVHFIINMAMHLRDPKNFCKPDSTSSAKPLNARTKNAKNLDQKNKNKFLFNVVSGNDVKCKDQRPKSLSITGINLMQNNTEDLKMFNKGSKEKASYLPNDQNNTLNYISDNYFTKNSFSNEEMSCAKNRMISYTLPRTTIHNVMNSKNSSIYSTELSKAFKCDTDRNISKEAVYCELVPFAPSSAVDSPLKEDNIMLLKDDKKYSNDMQNELSKLRFMKRYCCEHMTCHLEKLQENMMKQSLLYEDEMYIALAGLKKVRDILKGAVNFTEEFLQDDFNSYLSVSNSSHISIED